MKPPDSRLFDVVNSITAADVYAAGIVLFVALCGIGLYIYEGMPIKFGDDE